MGSEMFIIDSIYIRSEKAKEKKKKKHGSFKNYCLRKSPVTVQASAFWISGVLNTEL